MTTNESCNQVTTDPSTGRWRTDSERVTPPPLPDHCCEPEDAVRHADAPPLVCTPPSPRRSFDAFLKSVANDDVQSDRLHGKRESAGWMSSVIIHGLLLVLLAMFLAPADLSGIDMQALIFSFSDSDQDERDEGTSIAAVEVETPSEVPAAADADPQPINPTTESAVAKTDIAESGDSAQQSGATGGSAGAPGSFFGIAASGHDFVYVLDMSGSMRGRRFDRATAELIRSVDGLRVDQKFYVVLFNSGTVRMFADTGPLPKTIPATSKNKQRLSSWLRNAYEGGSTNPRGALRLALRMKPSAIFMLSDGKFDGQQNARQGMLQVDADAFAIVAAAAAKVPINAIAFENRASCHNMQRLSEMTGGEYRFAAADGAEDAKAALQLAQTAIDAGDQAKSVILLRDVIAVHGHTNAGWTARKKIAPMLSTSANDALGAGELELAFSAIGELIGIDPQADFSKDQQQILIDKLLQLADGNGTEQDKQKANAALANIVDWYPGSKSAAMLTDRIAATQLTEALQMDASGDPLRALKTLEQSMIKCPNAATAPQCTSAHQRIVDRLMDDARRTRQTGGEVAYANRLRSMSTKYAGTRLQAAAIQARKDLANAMILQVQTASMNRDAVLKAKLNGQLQEAFQGDRVLDTIQQQIARDELKARESLRRATRLEKMAHMDAARAQFESIIKRFPGTLSAAKANARLQDFKQVVVGDNEELAELILMMEK